MNSRRPNSSGLCSTSPATYMDVPSAALMALCTPLTVPSSSTGTCGCARGKRGVARGLRGLPQQVRRGGDADATQESLCVP